MKRIVAFLLLFSMISGLLWGCNEPTRVPVDSSSEQTTNSDTVSTEVTDQSTATDSEEKKDPSKLGKKTIVFFGDSVTEGYFEIKYNAAGTSMTSVKDTKAVYHNLLKERISAEYPDLDVEYINAGIGGTASPHGIKRIQTDVLDYNPDIVVVCFGLNDIPAMTISNYVNTMEQIFAVLQSKSIHVIYLTPNMYNTYRHEDVGKMHFDMADQLAALQNANKPDLYYDACKKMAEKRGVVVVDAYSEWKKLSSYGIDVTELLSNHLNHPTREMHKLFADMLYDDVVEMLFS